MADEPDSIVLDYMQRIDTKIDTLLENFDDIEVRLGQLASRVDALVHKLTATLNSE